MPGLTPLRDKPRSIRIRKDQLPSVIKLLIKEDRKFSGWITKLIDKEIKANKEFLQESE